MIWLHDVVVLAFMGVLAWAAGCDMRLRAVPDWVAIAIALLYLPFVLTAPGTVPWLGGVMTGVALFIIGAVLFGLKMIGGGDVKLMACTAVWAGSGALAPLLFVTAVAGLLLAVLLLASRRYAPVWARQWVREAPDEDPGGQSLPYAVAIAVGGCYIGITLLAR